MIDADGGAVSGVIKHSGYKKDRCILYCRNNRRNVPPMFKWHQSQIAARFFLGLILTLSAGACLAQARALPDFTDIVETTRPAVVNISTTQAVKGGPGFPHGQMPQMPEGTPFDEFFRRFFGQQGEGEGGDGGEGDGGVPEEFDGRSLGSGFVISPDGYILTNNHVIKDAKEIVVRLSNRREYVAELVGSSAKLKAGEWVLASGAPVDFDHSVTAGSVSALGRSLPNENYVPFIQTDVAINPGNSGGPLFNMDGEVIGVNSQIYSRTGGFMGLSFAIPIDLAMDVVNQIKTKGKVSRGWLGILIQDVTRELAESFGMDRPGGALVAQVLPDSPAQKAGIKVGDVVLEFNGVTITDSASLPPMVGRTHIGDEVQVKLIRSGKPLTVKVRIGELPPEDDVKLAGPAEKDKASNNRLGAVVSDLTAEQKQALEGKKSGVYVEDEKGGPARNAGRRRGDVILMVNNVDVKNLAHFQQLVKDLPAGKSVPMLVLRGSGPVFLALKMPEKGQ